MKTTIVSYYSDVDYVNDRFNGIDDVYTVDCPDNLNIKEEIEKAYDELEEKEEMTNQLSCMLDYLIEKGLDLKYEVINLEKFDCDYGKFREL